MPPAIAQAARIAVSIIKQEPERRAQLQENAIYLRQGLKELGFDTLHSVTPIIPLMVKEESQALAMSAALLSKGIFVQAIRPPTVPANSARLRMTVVATHTREDLDQLLNVMKAL